MGFNYRQPGRVKRADIIIFVSALVVIAVLVVWAAR
jgi:hypothetical protein